MAAPGAPHGRQQQEELGGQPLTYGNIAENQLLQRGNAASGTTHIILGHSDTTPLTGIRVGYIDVLNQSDSTYARFKCRNNADGIPELYLDSYGLS